MRSVGTKDRIILSCHEMVCTRAISIDTRVDKWVTGQRGPSDLLDLDMCAYQKFSSVY